MTSRRYKIENRRAELEAEIHRLEREMADTLGALKHNAAQLKDPRSWLEQFPLTLAGTGLVAGVLATVLITRSSTKRKHRRQMKRQGATMDAGVDAGSGTGHGAERGAASGTGGSASQSIAGMLGSELKRIVTRRLLNVGSQVLERAITDALSGRRPR